MTKWCPIPDKVCDKECPWWDDVNTRCEIKGISIGLFQIKKALQEIAKELKLLRAR